MADKNHNANEEQKNDDKLTSLLYARLQRQIDKNQCEEELKRKNRKISKAVLAFYEKEKNSWFPDKEKIKEFKSYISENSEGKKSVDINLFYKNKQKKDYAYKKDLISIEEKAEKEVKKKEMRLFLLAIKETVNQELKKFKDKDKAEICTKIKVLLEEILKFNPGTPSVFGLTEWVNKVGAMVVKMITEYQGTLNKSCNPDVLSKDKRVGLVLAKIMLEKGQKFCKTDITYKAAEALMDWYLRNEIKGFKTVSAFLEEKLLKIETALKQYDALDKATANSGDFFNKISAKKPFLPELPLLRKRNGLYIISETSLEADLIVAHPKKKTAESQPVLAVCAYDPKESRWSYRQEKPPYEEIVLEEKSDTPEPELKLEEVEPKPEGVKINKLEEKAKVADEAAAEVVDTSESNVLLKQGGKDSDGSALLDDILSDDAWLEQIEKETNDEYDNKKDVSPEQGDDDLDDIASELVSGMLLKESVSPSEEELISDFEKEKSVTAEAAEPEKNKIGHKGDNEGSYREVNTPTDIEKSSDGIKAESEGEKLALEKDKKPIKSPPSSKGFLVFLAVVIVLLIVLLFLMAHFAPGALIFSGVASLKFISSTSIFANPFVLSGIYSVVLLIVVRVGFGLSSLVRRPKLGKSHVNKLSQKAAEGVRKDTREGVVKQEQLDVPKIETGKIQVGGVEEHEKDINNKTNAPPNGSNSL